MRKIPLLIPSMPDIERIAPWLARVDQEKRYTNFGPLERTLRNHLLELISPDADNWQSIATVANATLGLELALSALELPVGSKILVPALTFPASASAICRSGHVPVICDVDERTWSLSQKVALEAIARFDIATVLPVSAYGYAYPTEAWDSFCESTGIPVIIDAAGAWGNQLPGRRYHTVYSLHATKALGSGEGGFICSANSKFIDHIRKLTNFGINADGYVDTIGTNAKLSEYHAAVALASLELWPSKQKQYCLLYDLYTHLLQAECPTITLQEKSREGIYPVLAVQLPDGGDIQRTILHLNEAGIETRRWYYPPLHRQPAFARFTTISCMETVNKISANLLGLPFHLELSERNVVYVVEKLKEALSL